MTFIKISRIDIEQHIPTPAIHDRLLHVEQRFLRLAFAFIDEQFMMPPRHGEYLLPKLGSDCDLLPGLGSDLQQRTIEEVEILHVEQIGLGETSCPRIGFF